MIAVLTDIAEQIAALRRFGEICPDPALQAIVVDLAQEYADALDKMAEQPGVLVGDMPWRSRWNAVTLPSASDAEARNLL